MTRRDVFGVFAGALASPSVAALKRSSIPLITSDQIAAGCITFSKITRYKIVDRSGKALAWIGDDPSAPFTGQWCIGATLKEVNR